MSYKYVEMEELKKYIFSEVLEDNDRIIFKSSCGKTFILQHVQNCCESVYILKALLVI